MPALVVPNACQVRLIWQLATIQAVNVLGAQVVGATTINQALANSLGAAIKARLTSSGQVAHLAGGAQLANVGVRDIRSANNAEFLDVGAGVVGTAAGDVLPYQIALCVTLRTARAGAAYRGRVFLPFYGEVDNTPAGAILAAAQTAAAAFINGIGTDMTTNGLTFSVVSRPTYDENGTQTRAGFATPVTTALVRDARWDTQRRRVS